MVLMYVGKSYFHKVLKQGQKKQPSTQTLLSQRGGEASLTVFSVPPVSSQIMTLRLPINYESSAYSSDLFLTSFFFPVSILL